MISDFICDSIVYNTDLTPLTDGEWNYLLESAEFFGVDYVVAMAKKQSDCGPKEFKAAMTKYMREFGYEGSIMWNKFHRMPINNIAQIIG